MSIDGNKSWNWNVLDRDTRLLLAEYVSHTRTLWHTKEPLHKATLAALNKPIAGRTRFRIGYLVSRARVSFEAAIGYLVIGPRERIRTIQ